MRIFAQTERMNLTCTDCLIKKTKKDFYIRTGGDRHRQCKPCMRSKEKERKDSNPEISRRYYENNKEYYKRKYSEWSKKNKKKLTDKSNDWGKRKRDEGREMASDYYVKITFKLTKDFFYLIPEYRNIILTNRLIKKIEKHGTN